MGRETKDASLKGAFSRGGPIRSSPGRPAKWTSASFKASPRSRNGERRDLRFKFSGRRPQRRFPQREHRAPRQGNRGLMKMEVCCQPSWRSGAIVGAMPLVHLAIDSKTPCAAVSGGGSPAPVTLSTWTTGAEHPDRGDGRAGSGSRSWVPRMFLSEVRDYADPRRGCVTPPLQGKPPPGGTRLAQALSYALFAARLVPSRCPRLLKGASRHAPSIRRPMAAQVGGRSTAAWNHPDDRPFSGKGKP